MDRKNLLIASGLIGIIIVLIIGIFIFYIPISADNSTAVSNSINDPAAEKDLTFDNKTPEAAAISIARLNEGGAGFSRGNYITANASLSSDENYWIVNMHLDGYDDWIVTIDAKTLMSKKNEGIHKPMNTWRSLDELKARYIAEIQSGDSGVDFGRPYKVTLEGKTVWKVPVYNINPDGQELNGYVYVDVATGKSKNTWDEFNKAAGTDGWLTLKEIDDTLNKMHDWGPAPFRNALIDLYPE